MPAVIVVMTAAAYAMYSSVGLLVFGFAGGYAKEEGIETGTRYFLLELVQHVRGLGGVPVGAYVACCAVVMGGVVLVGLETGYGRGLWWCCGKQIPCEDDRKKGKCNRN